MTITLTSADILIIVGDLSVVSGWAGVLWAGFSKPKHQGIWTIAFAASFLTGAVLLVGLFLVWLFTARQS